MSAHDPGRSADVGPTDDPIEDATVTMEELVRLAGVVGRRLTDLGATASTAESCTGGLIGHLLTEISGSSAWYVGGAVVYSDTLKQGLVDVPADVIATQGAVSGAVAAAMAAGARSRFATDHAVAVTGIAGPSGGTAAKPVGLVFVAVAGPGGTVVERHLWRGDRSANKRESAHAALRLLLDRLML